MRARDTNRRVSNVPFEYGMCAACETVFLINIPADLGRYYPRAYYDVPTSLTELDAQTEGDRFKVDLIHRFIPAGRLIEIGPAFGRFARVAQQAGYEVEAIEMDERCCTFLREVVGIPVTQSDDVVTALEASESANAVVLWHVLEHLREPWPAIAAAAARLRSGGILVIATPNPAALQFRLFGRYWSHLDAPRHLQLLSAATIAERGRQFGLEAVLTTITDEGSLGWNSFGWASTARNFFRHPALRLMAYFLGRVMNKLASPIERRGWRGSAYTIVLRRAQAAS